MMLLASDDGKIPSITTLDGATLLNNVLGMLTQFAIVGGAFWAIWGVIVLAGGLKDKNGPALQSGIWQIVGGILIIVAAAMFNTVAHFQQ